MESKSAGWSDSTKWLFGLIGAVVTGLLVWYLTHAGGPLNPQPKPPPKEPAITITAFRLPIVLQTNNPEGTFTITNEGDAVARQCILRGDVSPALGDQFSVPAHDSTTINWGIFTYGRSGNVRFSAWVQCANGKSPVATQDGIVIGS
jgi:hypothetical protein